MKCCELCERPKFALTYCRTHYYQDLARRNGPCQVDGRHRNAKLGNLKMCEVHYYRTPDQISKALMRTYGITYDEYESLLKAQDGKCAICMGEPTGRNAVNGRFDVDHNHATGKVRGLLCGDCNVSLGKMKDDPTILRRAAEYLENYGG